LDAARAARSRRRGIAYPAAPRHARLRSRALRAASRAAVADARRAHAAHACAARSRIASAPCGDRSRLDRHRSDAPPRRAAHSLLMSALRRCRQPVPARVAIADGRPIRVTTDRRGFAGGVVVHCAGPWRTSGDWWAGSAGEVGGTTPERSARGSSECECASEVSGRGAPRALRNDTRASARDSLEPLRGAHAPSNSGGGGVPAAINKSGAPREVKNGVPRAFNRDEWDISLSDGAVYRIFQ